MCIVWRSRTRRCPSLSRRVVPLMVRWLSLNEFQQRAGKLRKKAEWLELQPGCKLAFGRIADRLSGAAVPDDHLASAVLARGDRPFEATGPVLLNEERPSARGGHDWNLERVRLSARFSATNELHERRRWRRKAAASVINCLTTRADAVPCVVRRETCAIPAEGRFTARSVPVPRETRIDIVEAAAWVLRVRRNAVAVSRLVLVEGGGLVRIRTAPIVFSPVRQLACRIDCLGHALTCQAANDRADCRTDNCAHRADDSPRRCARGRASQGSPDARADRMRTGRTADRIAVLFGSNRLVEFLVGGSAHVFSPLMLTNMSDPPSGPAHAAEVRATCYEHALRQIDGQCDNALMRRRYAARAFFFPAEAPPPACSSCLRSSICAPRAVRSSLAFFALGNISSCSSFTWWSTFSPRTVTLAS